MNLLYIKFLYFTVKFIGYQLIKENFLGFYLGNMHFLGGRGGSEEIQGSTKSYIARDGYLIFFNSNLGVWFLKLGIKGEPFTKSETLGKGENSILKFYSCNSFHPPPKNECSLWSSVSCSNTSL